ncbi:MAG: cell division protein FtsZ, partial [Gammaproteobacteria bacterium]|nr:cell division protein FtsZ [Gammaproteobacteria bacterium]
AVQGIAELITRPGMINVDFADVRTVMSEKGRAMMGSGKATGDDRARRAAEAAIACPLLEDVNLSGARGILVNVTAGPDLGMDEFAAVGEAIGEFASENALVVIGTALDENVKDELRVTVVATGLGQQAQRAERDVRLVANAGAGSTATNVDYKRFDMPTVMRKHPKGDEGRAGKVDTDADYLDIPAFLRRQAD